MITYSSELNFSISLLRSSVDPFSFPKIRHSKLDPNLVNPSIINLFDSLNLDIVLFEVFYSKPFFNGGIHIDSTGGDINKINWIYGGQGCKMNWYSIKDPNLEKRIDTPIGTKSQLFDPSAVNLEFSKVLSSPSLVHVGVPHNVRNMKEDRWCVSLVYRFKNSNKRPTMKESLDIFKNFIK